jgi:hypothetical protein
VYTGTSGSPTFVTASQSPGDKPSNLLDPSGRIFGRGRPMYSTYAPEQIISVKSQGAKGDGQTDDTAALQAVFNTVTKITSFWWYITKIRDSTQVAASSISMLVLTLFLILW